MSGAEIRKMILDSGIYLWKVADKFGITDWNFSRKLRHDFSEEETNRVIAIIAEIKNEGK